MGRRRWLRGQRRQRQRKKACGPSLLHNLTCTTASPSSTNIFHPSGVQDPLLDRQRCQRDAFVWRSDE
jgi:hypothetical protein